MNIKEATKAYASNPEAMKAGEAQLQAILERSATDAPFRAKLLSDPRAAVSEFTGRPVDGRYNIAFVENKADATFVLPDAYSPDAELSDAELETVAGGEPVTALAIACVLFVAFVAGACSD